MNENTSNIANHQIRLIFLFCLKFIAFISINNSQAQNLVNNWSFEDTVSCPNGLSQIFNSIGWYSTSNSPDYFNNCSQSQVQVPFNDFDYQLPKSGNAYAGFYTENLFAGSAREIISSELNSILQIGTKYYVKFFVSRVVNENAGWSINVAVNKLGVQFSTVQYLQGIPSPINNFSQVYTDSIITDTLNWTEISGSFIADSNYQYIAIGNFFQDTSLLYIQYGTNVNSYYFLDNICVSPDSNFCNLLNDVKNIPNITNQIFPNPARDWIVVRAENLKSLLFYDVSGRLVRSFRSPVPLTVELNSFSPGLYTLSVETKNGIYFHKLLILN